MVIANDPYNCMHLLVQWECMVVLNHGFMYCCMARYVCRIGCYATYIGTSFVSPYKCVCVLSDVVDYVMVWLYAFLCILCMNGVVC